MNIAKFHPWIQPAVVDYVKGMIRELKELEAQFASKNNEILWSPEEILSARLKRDWLKSSMDSLRWKLLLWT